MAVVEWVLQSRAGTAADIGAGTGALTRRVQERADKVIAVEPDVRMLEVLQSRSPELWATQGWAENLPIRSGSLDAVTISSAWHWMDPDQALAEVARVLRPGGVLGVIWNGANRTVEWVDKLLGARDPIPGEGDRGTRHRFELPPQAPFAGLEGNVFRWSMAMNQEQLVGLAGTYSSMITMSPELRERERARIEAATAPWSVTARSRSRWAVVAGERCERSCGERQIALVTAPLSFSS